MFKPSWRERRLNRLSHLRALGGLLFKTQVSTEGRQEREVFETATSLGLSQTALGDIMAFSGTALPVTQQI
jgi:hypothetical protein